MITWLGVALAGRTLNGVDAGCAEGVGGDFGLALSVVLRAYLNAASRVFDDIPGAARGFQVLASAANYAPPTQLALGRQLGIDRSVLTYLLDDLERAKLLERRADPADRRARRIVLTRTGEATLNRLSKRLRAAEQQALRGLTPDEQQTLCTLLARASSAAANQDESACEVVDEVRASINS